MHMRLAWHDDVRSNDNSHALQCVWHVELWFCCLAETAVRDDKSTAVLLTVYQMVHPHFESGVLGPSCPRQRPASAVCLARKKSHSLLARNCPGRSKIMIVYWPQNDVRSQGHQMSQLNDIKFDAKAKPEAKTECL